MIETLPFKAVPVHQLLADDLAALPDLPGLYAMTFKQGDRLLERWRYFDFDRVAPPEICGASALYLGETAVMGLRSRVRSHLCKDARSSTFRMTIGTLLADQLDLQPVLTPRKRYFYFGREGEARLTRWLAQHASVAFVACQDALAKEKALLRSLAIPLNIKERRTHPYSRHLIQRRGSMVWGDAASSGPNVQALSGSERDAISSPFMARTQAVPRGRSRLRVVADDISDARIAAKAGAPRHV